MPGKCYSYHFFFLDHGYLSLKAETRTNVVKVQNSDFHGSFVYCHERLSQLRKSTRKQKKKSEKIILFSSADFFGEIFPKILEFDFLIFLSITYTLFTSFYVLLFRKLFCKITQPCRNFIKTLPQKFKTLEFLKVTEIQKCTRKFKMSCIVWNSDDSLESADLIKKLFGSEEIKQEGKRFTRTFIN